MTEAMQVMRSRGGFRFLPADGPFSAGVAAEQGYQIVRAHPPRNSSLEDGFALVERVLTAAGRPLDSLCAMELRIPKPFTLAGFNEFNRGYVDQHDRWGLRIDGRVPAARTNVAPELDAPTEPSLHAFCHTVEGVGPPTFVISGMGSRGGLPADWATMVRTLEDRMTALGVGWDDVGEAQLYGTRDNHDLFATDELERLAEMVRPGLRWYFARPPVDFGRLEVDVRALARDTWL